MYSMICKASDPPIYPIYFIRLTQLTALGSLGLPYLGIVDKQVLTKNCNLLNALFAIAILQKNIK